MPRWCWNGCGGTIRSSTSNSGAYLFKDGDIMAAERAEGGAEPADAGDGSLGIGDLRKEEVAP